MPRAGACEDFGRAVILIAGGTGRLGRIVATGLVGRGEHVRILTRGAGPPPAPGIEMVRGDIQNPMDVERAVRGARIVVSAMSAFGMKGGRLERVDARGNQRLIASCQACGVDQFVLVSVRDASRDHPSSLHQAKYGAEEALAASRLSWKSS